MPPKKGMKSKTHKGDLDYTTKRGDKDYHRGGHDEKEKKKPFSEKKSTKSKSKPKTEEIKFTKGESKGETLKFKEGTLRAQLKMKKGDKFTKAEMDRLDKISVGDRFKFKGNDFKMTKLLKDRVELGKTLMGFKKKK